METLTKIDNSTVEISVEVPPIITTRTLADVQAEIDSKTKQIEDCDAQKAVYTERLDYLNDLLSRMVTEIGDTSENEEIGTENSDE